MDRIGLIIILIIGIAFIGFLGLTFFGGESSNCTYGTTIYESQEDIEVGPREPHSEYNYRSLSEDAQTIFDRTLPDGKYNFTDGSLDPPEFTYSDTIELYAVNYQNETYYVQTVGGCRP